jgi:hypothetical protein
MAYPRLLPPDAICSAPESKDEIVPSRAEEAVGSPLESTTIKVVPENKTFIPPARTVGKLLETTRLPAFSSFTAETPRKVLVPSAGDVAEKDTLSVPSVIRRFNASVPFRLWGVRAKVPPDTAEREPGVTTRSSAVDPILEASPLLITL